MHLTFLDVSDDDTDTRNAPKCAPEVYKKTVVVFKVKCKGRKVDWILSVGIQACLHSPWALFHLECRCASTNCLYHNRFAVLFSSFRFSGHCFGGQCWLLLANGKRKESRSTVHTRQIVAISHEKHCWISAKMWKIHGSIGPFKHHLLTLQISYGRIDRFLEGDAYPFARIYKLCKILFWGRPSKSHVSQLIK